MHVRRVAFGRSDGTIAAYEWTFGDGTTLYQPSGTPTATHIYRTGTFTVQLVVRDNAGASATVSTTVQTVNLPPVASFVSTCDSVRCTVDASASMDPDGRALANISWNFGDGYGASGMAIQEHIYAGPGTSRIVLTVADDVAQQRPPPPPSRSHPVRCTSVIWTAPALQARGGRRFSM